MRSQVIQVAGWRDRPLQENIAPSVFQHAALGPMPTSDEIIASMIAALPEEASPAAVQEFRGILEMLVAAACKEQIARIEADLDRAYRAFQDGNGASGAGGCGRSRS